MEVLADYLARAVKNVTWCADIWAAHLNDEVCNILLLMHDIYSHRAGILTESSSKL